MIKVVTLRCPACGNTVSFRVGADAKFATWHDVAAYIKNEKEYEKLLETYSKISGLKDELEMLEFGNNPVESFCNIRYDLLGEDSTKLLALEESDTEEAYFNEKAQESIAAGAQKWESDVKADGVLAFEGMYLCPKTYHVKQGIHLSMHWHDGAKEKTYVCRNYCDECSAPLTLLDDGNIGFMHEDCPTVGRCEQCKTQLVVDKVSFKLPQKESENA